jgi:hypothetical protein
MIVSSRHRFVFVAIPKTGTHSVRQALRDEMGPDDWEQVKLFVDKAAPIPELARIGHGHITLAQLRPHLPAAEFDSFFKFAFVRNPFDRFVSFCSFMTRANDAFERDPQGVMRHILFTSPPLNHVLFVPQHLFVTDGDGTMLADEIGRVETMQESYDRICERIGIDSRPLGRANSSKREDYRRYYDQQLIDGVARLYARDLDLFGYSF